MKLSKAESDSLLFSPRSFVVKIDGIWRAVMGTYIPPIQDPLSIKCILNGKEVVVGPKNCIDYYGISLYDLESEVIRLNFETLPQAKRRKIETKTHRFVQFVGTNNDPLPTVEITTTAAAGT